MQKTDQSRDSEPFFNIGKGMRKKIRQFIIILAMLMFTAILNIFLENFIQSSLHDFIYIVPAIAGTVNLGTLRSDA